jgi:hypothetical protein
VYFSLNEFSCLILYGSLRFLVSRDGAARLARQAHNLKVVGSNPTPATIFLRELCKKIITNFDLVLSYFYE